MYFKGRLPMRVDKFVIQHLNYLDGKLKLAYADHNQIKNIISDPEITKYKRSDFTVKSIEENTRSSTYISNKITRYNNKYNTKMRYKLQ